MLVAEKWVTRIALVVFLLCVLVLFYSAIVSGINYTIDNDEFIQSQDAYLIMNGLIPYKDFFSPHSALFHGMLIPIFNFKGFTFDAIIMARLLMVVFFGIRILSTWLLVKTLFGRLTSLIFIPMFLFDPLTVFSGMQIRPENASLTFYSLGLALLSITLIKKSKFVILFSGVLIGLSFVLSLKLLPSVVILFLFYLIYTLKLNNIKIFINFALGFTIPVFLFCIYFFMRNGFWQMIQGLFIDPKPYIDATLYPVQIGGLFFPDNSYIFGLPGKNLPWAYEWLLPTIGGAGMFKVFESGLMREGKTYVIKIVLGLSFISSFLVLLISKTVFAQYYLIFNWHLAILGAVFIGGIIKLLSGSKALTTFSYALLLIIFLAFTKQAMESNFARSLLNFTPQQKMFETRWRQIPENTYTYPNFLFRPLAFPITYGHFYGDFPKSIITRFEKIETALEAKKIQILLISDYEYKMIPENTKAYINAYYKRVAGDDLMWKRFR